MNEAGFRTRLLLLGVTIRERSSGNQTYTCATYHDEMIMLLTYPSVTGRPPEPLDTAYERIVEHIRTREDKS